MLRQKPTQVLLKDLLEEATINFYCLLDESRFSNICTIMELKELNLCERFSNTFCLTDYRAKQKGTKSQQKLLLGWLLEILEIIWLS